MRKHSYLGLTVAILAFGSWGGTALAATADNANPATAQATVADGGSVPASSNEFSFATGFDYSAGHYGSASDTTVWNIPVDLKAQIGRLRLQATLPYTFIKGPGQIVGGVVVSAPGGQVTARSGIGDLNLSAAYLVVRESGLLPSIELGGSVKAPTAKGTIGTGKTDYSATASVYKSLTAKVLLFGTVGYSWLGSPATYRLQNGLLASGGLNFRPAQNQNYGVSVAYREPIVAGLKGQAVVSPYITYRVSKLFGVTLYGVAGLNDASPRIGGGLRLTLFQ